jgi:hypothetical protein
MSNNQFGNSESRIQDGAPAFAAKEPILVLTPKPSRSDDEMQKAIQERIISLDSKKEPIVSRINSAYENTPLFNKFERLQWQKITTLNLFGIESIENINFEPENVATQLGLYYKYIGLGIDDAEGYKSKARNFINGFLEKANLSMLFIPQDQSQIELFNLKSGKACVLRFDRKKSCWDFIKYYEKKTLPPDIETKLVPYVVNLIYELNDLKDCGLFPDPETQKKINDRMNRVQYLLRNLKNDYWTNLILEKRGSFDNII